LGETVIKFPRNLYTDVVGLNFLSSQFSKIATENNHLILDFTKNIWTDANLSSIISLLIDCAKNKNNSRITIRHIDNEVMKIFRKNGFFEKYDLSIEKDVYDSTIPLRDFNVDQEEDFLYHLIEKVMPKINFRNTIDPGVVKSFQSSLSEIFTNVRLHSDSDKVYTCGQLFYNKEKVSFTIVNQGRTIKDNVNNITGKQLTDSESIYWAIKEGNTTKRVSDNGGLGFPIVKNFLANNNGTLFIKSGRGMLIYNDNNVRFKEYTAHFPGTIVSIESSLKKPLFWSD